VKAILNDADYMDDSIFLPRIAALVHLEPLLAQPVADMTRIATKHLEDVVRQKVSTILGRIKTVQRDSLRKAFEHDLAQVCSEAVRSAQEVFLASTADIFINNPRYVGFTSCVLERMPHTLRHVDVVETVKKSGGRWEQPSYYGSYGSGGMFSQVVHSSFHSFFCRTELHHIWVKADAEASPSRTPASRLSADGRR
jgi:hypothetical protein